MKNLFIIILSLLVLPSFAQEPDFKFYIAFEDAIGAKDTMWAIFDSTSSFSFPDSTFGEMGQSMPNDTTFKVYIKYTSTDSGKVRAEPTTNPCTTNLLINAVNYVYPIIVRWDTALFNQDPTLFNITKATFQNDYFFINWNDTQYPNEFNMLIIDSVVLPSFTWGSQDHFPLFFQMQSFVTDIEEFSNLNKFKFYPNPTSEKIYLSVNDNVAKFNLSVLDIAGKEILQFKVLQNPVSVNLSNLQKGSYFLKISYQDKIDVKPLIKY